MRIGLCSRRDPYNKRSWSGLEYYMLKALEKYCGEVIPLGPLSTNYILLGKILEKLIAKIVGKNFRYIHSPLIAKRYAELTKLKINEKSFDLLFFPGACEVLSYLDIPNIPKVYFSDTTFKQMTDYYDSFSNLLNVSEKWGNEIEKNAIDKADIVLYSSRWAAESAVCDYECPTEKIHVITCGGNLASIPKREVIFSKDRDKESILKLLFIGGDWERKGGDIAFESMVELNKRGIDTRLIVCGRAPASIRDHEKIEFVGFLDQNDPEELLKFHKLYLDSSMFVLPSRSECFGFVFAEAAANGLPIISTNTGGIPDYVEHAVNGYLLPREADSWAYADKIEHLWHNKDKYKVFSRNSRDKFERELNWDVWGRKVSDLFVKTLSH